MYLKSIEMQGFKSFAVKTKLEFHNGVTGIVGPNGSGKSNVGDAVRWVLGEQSAKQLRGGNMQDVIFAGTESRKPLGFASVAITLDNADRKLNFDADEVTVTRKLYRSGDSEYLMNGRACRLRDINELFYDTGIGKEGYSIIGQGQIDKILSGKPDDRRELFDEAVGIVKFKRRKMASLKKLNEEESNLVRVSDILSEVTRQLGPLERQAGKAEEYLTKRDALRTMEIQMFQIEEGVSEARLKELEGKKKIAEDQLEAIGRQLEETRTEYDKVELELEELSGKAAETREQAQETALKKQQSEGRIAVLQEQILAAEANTKLYKDRLEAIEAEQTQRLAARDIETQEKEKLTEDLIEAEKKKNAAEKRVQELQHAITSLQNEAEKGRSAAITLLNQRASIRAKVQRYDTMQEQIEIRRSQLSSRMIAMKGSENQETERLKELEQELQKVNASVEARKASIAKKEKQEIQLRDLLNEENRQLESAQSNFHRDSSRLESLQNITERYEGYGNSIKKVMEQKDRNPGIHGVVADLIKTGKKYETAIETALGGSLQNIVTDNESTAKYLIEYLKRGHYGRATFLPLTAMRNDSGFNQPAVLKEPGVIGKADTLVTNDPEYDGLVRRLLGKTIVVDTIDHAIAVSRRYKQSIRMVTLEGELLSPGGSMTGGSFRHTSNLLGRRREIEELENSVRTLKQDIETMQHTIETNRSQRNMIRNMLAEEREELQKELLLQNTARVNFDTAHEKAEGLQKDYRKLLRESGEIDIQVAEITENRSVIKEELDNSEKEEARLTEEIRKASEEAEKLQEDEKTALEIQDKSRLEFSTILQQVSFIDEKIASADEELKRLQEEHAGIVSGLDNESDNAGSREKLIEDLQKECAELEEKRTALNEQAAALDAQREEKNKAHKEFFERRDSLSEEKTQMDQEAFRLQAQIEKQQESREAQINYLYEEYQLTPDQAESIHFDEIPERTPLKLSIREKKAEIKALGNINVNAIDEYKELKERHDFLSTQHDDLVKASETLKDIIAQLDEGMRRQFQEGFEKIRVEFDKVFKLLFGGGKGTLELVEGEDILESGIVIISQPPGKKLQNMMQLSGGEKALTAIALLFAIQNLKPSPFCLLDEIEAALDDNNVTRFAQYLHKLTKNTQFIIITHRRGTMAAADRLYGITMQEKGVSTLVSVDLIESQLDA
ncbi:MAG: chromosome segregation protein SMC [Eubacteriales bacterium]|nr:chromosome segregation protein SMC [Eubacteriales bacterium]